MASGLPELRGFWLWLARVIWVLIALSCIYLFILGTVAQYDRIRAPCSILPVEEQSNCFPTENALQQLGLTWDDLANFYTPIATVATLPFIFMGCLVFWRKSRNRIGLLFSLGFVIMGSTSVNQDLIGDLFSAFPNLSLPVTFFHFLSNMAPVIFISLFPDGRFVPRWTRWWVIAWAGRNLSVSISRFLVPSFGNSLWWNFYDPILNTIMLVLGIYAIVFRYRHDAGPVQRQQIKWVVVAFVVETILLIGLNMLGRFWQPGLFDLFRIIVYSPLYYAGALFVAVCLGISISRYRLWDIDFLINRTLVYSLLTALIVSLYVIVVGLLGTAIQGRSNLLISILATGLVAVLVQPLRDTLQRGINRLMYGERDNPVTVLSRLGQRLEATIAPDSILPALVETVSQTLKLPYAAITWGADHNGEVAASYGKPISDVIRLPLSYRGETIGQFVVAPRAPGEVFSPADHHLLKNIAHQAGMAVHAVSLKIDLQRSRQQLVTAREEERRRLRRDLHDGLGPNLASQGLKLAAVKQLLENNPAAAIPLLDQVMEQNKSTVDDVRHLVYGLRPPALDELGLVAAIRDHVAGMDGKSTLQIEITEPSEGLPPLSAAVEVAAYRITLEALTNVIRHAQANRCAIRFSVNREGSRDDLQIEIQDDGKGMPETHRAGVGLRSMRERAEELGGACVIESSAAQGTCVNVKVPLVRM
jgi:signal transduction histidine kinase